MLVNVVIDRPADIRLSLSTFGPNKITFKGKGLSRLKNTKNLNFSQTEEVEVVLNSNKKGCLVVAQALLEQGANVRAISLVSGLGELSFARTKMVFMLLPRLSSITLTSVITTWKSWQAWGKAIGMFGEKKLDLFRILVGGTGFDISGLLFALGNVKTIQIGVSYTATINEEETKLLRQNLLYQTNKPERTRLETVTLTCTSDVYDLVLPAAVRSGVRIHFLGNLRYFYDGLLDALGGQISKV